MIQLRRAAFTAAPVGGWLDNAGFQDAAAEIAIVELFPQDQLISMLARSSEGIGEQLEPQAVYSSLYADAAARRQDLVVIPGRPGRHPREPGGL